MAMMPCACDKFGMCKRHALIERAEAEKRHLWNLRKARFSRSQRQ